MFPAKQNYFQVQEYMDLVLSIPILGPINSLNDLCGERALGQIKRVKKMSNPDGISYEKMVMERHVNREINILKSFILHQSIRPQKKLLILNPKSHMIKSLTYSIVEVCVLLSYIIQIRPFMYSTIMSLSFWFL